MMTDIPREERFAAVQSFDEDFWDAHDSAGKDGLIEYVIEQAKEQAAKDAKYDYYSRITEFGPASSYLERYCLLRFDDEYVQMPTAWVDREAPSTDHTRWVGVRVTFTCRMEPLPK